MSPLVHHVRFYSPKTAAIHCLALHSDGDTLALSRNNASIEIWNLRGVPILSRYIPGTPSGSIEAMCWVKDRLLSTGLSGAVVEWDLKTLSIKSSLLVTGYAAWCIDVTKSARKIAVGTEQGYINIFSVDNDIIQYEKIFDKQEGRILCCKFDVSGEILVTGSIETIRIWNVATGQALHRMTTGRAEKNKETIVWCVEITSDLTVISGDSRGRLTFWDARVGEQIESLQTHKADVLAICLSEDQKSLYCTGVDPNIVNYAKVKMKHKGEDEYVEKWVKNLQRNIHQHDVRAMVMFKNKLFTGGIDGYLAMSSFPPKLLIKYPPILPYNAVSFCKESKMICLRYESSIEIWQLGMANPSSYSIQEDENAECENAGIVNGFGKTNGEKETNDVESENVNIGRRLKLSEGPKLIVRLSTPQQTPLVCYAISPNNKWIAYSTETHFRIFKFSMENGSPTLSKLVPLPDDCISVYKMAFAPNSNTLIIASADGVVQILYIHNDGAVTINSTLDTKSVLSSCMLTHLHISEITKRNSFYLILADVDSNIGAWEIDEESKSASFIAQLPRYEYPPSALAVDSQNSNLIIAYTNQKLVEYNLQKLRFTKWSENLNSERALGTRWHSRLFPIVGISVHPTLPHIVMAHDDSAIYVINKNTECSENIRETKKSKRNSSKSEEKVSYTIKKYKHLVGAGWVSEANGDVDCAVVVVEPASILEKLPPIFYKPRFGCL
ncbi:UTP4 small subunit processome component l(3)72Dn isoform X2 [Arctopsyche grandis]|uniref:UTP4 small subunit processome component l(3)72Dn isoform X2 n=1 Tax=Arctopsyche grandis TaxID=121162 RepID=UPI00406D9E8A